MFTLDILVTLADGTTTTLRCPRRFATDSFTVINLPFFARFVAIARPDVVETHSFIISPA